jgi:hypothetical protein
MSLIHVAYMYMFVNGKGRSDHVQDVMEHWRLILRVRVWVEAIFGFCLNPVSIHSCTCIYTYVVRPISLSGDGYELTIDLSSFVWCGCQFKKQIHCHASSTP